MITAPTLTAVPLTPVVAADAPASLDVLVRLRGPDEDPARLAARRPIALSLVLDQSGSMRGRPLEESKDCSLRIIDAMRDDDWIAVSAYDDTVTPVLPCMKVKDARPIARSRIAAITDGGATALRDGWLHGADAIADRVGACGVVRVLLLSDGNVNRGISDPAHICRDVAAVAEAGVTTSTYGLGRSFNEDLMLGMARGGGGNAYYGETADDLWPSFRAEFDVLGAVVGRRVRLRAGDPAAVLVNDYERTPDGAARLPDVAAGAEVWALWRIALPALPAGAVHEIAFEAGFENPADGTIRTLAVTCGVAAVHPDVAATATEDPGVAERRRELEAARLQREARAKAGRGDWEGVDATLSRIEGMAGDNAYVAGVAGSLRAMAATRDGVAFSKEAAFAATAMSTRYAAVDEDHRSTEATRSFATRKIRQGKGDGSSAGAAPPAAGGVPGGVSLGNAPSALSPLGVASRLIRTGLARVSNPSGDAGIRALLTKARRGRGA